MKWLLGMTGVMQYTQHQGSGDVDGAIPHICQKQIPIPIPFLIPRKRERVDTFLIETET